MKRAYSLKAAPTFAVILALTSISAQGASLKGGTTAVNTQAVAKTTAAQSAQQAGSVKSDSPAEGAARRERKGSFANAASQAIKENKVSEQDKELTKHLADVEAFLNMIQPDNSGYTIRSTQRAILRGEEDYWKLKMHEFVSQLAREDEESLHALFYLVTTHSYSGPIALKVEKPELSAAVDRLLNKAIEAQFIKSSRAGFNTPPFLPEGVFGAPGARGLLHKLTDSKEQRNARTALAKTRGSILNLERAQQSVERMVALKNYLAPIFNKADIQPDFRGPFMEKLYASSIVTANGGVIISLNQDPNSITVWTAYGKMTFKYWTRTADHDADLIAKLKQDLGLVEIESTSRYQSYSVTRLPDGTKLPKAQFVKNAPVTPKEIAQLVSRVPEKTRGGAFVDVDLFQ